MNNDRAELLLQIRIEDAFMKALGFFVPPRTTGELNHNRLRLGEPPWSDIELKQAPPYE